MKTYHPYRFPSLAQLAEAGPVAVAAGSWQQSLSEGYAQGRGDGYREGHESGLSEGYREGLAAARADGLAQGRDEGLQKVLASFETLARPLDAMLAELQRLQADYQSAQRSEVVDLVAKVARQVIRAELALKPVQMLALVDETLAAMPATRDEIEVYLNPEELQRIRELDPERAARWALIADAHLAAGECRVKAGMLEADAGCQQRLAACMEQVSAQLAEVAEEAGAIAAAIESATAAKSAGAVR